MVKLDFKKLAKKHETPLFIVEPDKAVEQYNALCSLLPKVKIFYSVKTLADFSVIKVLDAAGCGFDLASKNEVSLVSGAKVSPAKCIYTNPVKKVSDIEYSLDCGCNVFVIDNVYELEKFKKFKEITELILRINIDNDRAVVPLSNKYGCSVSDVPAIFEQASSMGIYIYGLSFHVGSQSLTPDAHINAIKTCRDIISSDIGNTIRVLDIGGGFPVQYSDNVMNIVDFCRPIADELSKIPDHVQVIAEPGRFITAPVGTCISSVVGKATRDGKRWYYIDDGVYGTYSGVIFDGAKYSIKTLKDDQPLFSSVLAGPTCDGLDVIDYDVLLPELDEGDLVIGEQMGAYTIETATTFCSLHLAKRIVI